MPRFVILQHDWRGPHSDLMLEDPAVGRLRTWAVRPPIDLEAESTERLVARLPDHRLAYLDYQGPISGGRGTVLRLARGIYEPIEWLDHRVLASLAVEGDSSDLRLGLERIEGDPACRDETPGAFWTLRLGKVI